MLDNYGYTVSDATIAKYEKELNELISQIETIKLDKLEKSLARIGEEYDNWLKRLKHSIDKETVINLAVVLTKYDMLQALVINRNDYLARINKETEIIALGGKTLNKIVKYMHDNPGVTYSELCSLYNSTEVETNIDRLYNNGFIAKSVYTEGDSCYLLTNYGNRLYKRIEG